MCGLGTVGQRCSRTNGRGRGVHDHANAHTEWSARTPCASPRQCQGAAALVMALASWHEQAPDSRPGALVRRFGALCGVGLRLGPEVGRVAGPTAPPGSTPPRRRWASPPRPAPSASMVCPKPCGSSKSVAIKSANSGSRTGRAAAYPRMTLPTTTELSWLWLIPVRLMAEIDAVIEAHGGWPRLALRPLFRRSA